MSDFGQELIDEMDGGAWPLPREKSTRETVTRRRALRKGEKSVLRQMAQWFDDSRAYLVVPVPKFIAKTFADFLLGEEPEYGSEAVQGELDDLIEKTNFTARLRRAIRVMVSEGETWWKIHTNPLISDAPIIEWHSRLATVPLFYGERVMAVAFVSIVKREAADDHEDVRPDEVVWRLAEVHSDGYVRNVLFRGTEDSIGIPKDLTALGVTQRLPAEWNHGLPMLAGRMVNDIDEDVTIGESAYDQVQDLMLALNEAITISSENARLTGKDRIFAEERFTKDGQFDAGVEVFTQNSEGGMLGGEAGKSQIVAIEKKYDSEALWHHIGKLKAEVLSQVGIVAQMTGEQTETGAAPSGVALRMRFLPTLNASEGMGVEVDATAPTALHLLLRVAALPAGNDETPGGFGWQDPGDEPPSFERAQPLPADEGEIVQTNALAVTSGIRSRREAIKAQHPDWSDAEVDDELAAIEADNPMPEMPAVVDDPHDNT